MERFDRYEENFLNCSRIISRTILQLESANSNVDAFISASVDIEGELAEAEANVRALDVEFRTMSSIEKRNSQAKVNGYKEEYKNLLSQYQTVKFQMESALLKGSTTNADRKKMLTMNHILDQSTATLENSRMILAETEDIGSAILTDIEGQRQKLGEAKDNLDETGQLAFQAKTILTSMYTNAIMHKVGVFVLMIILLGAIVGVGYEAFIVNGSDD